MPGEFGRTMFRTLVRGSPAKIHRVIPNELSMPLKSTKKVWLGIYRTQTRPNEQDIVAISGQWLDISEYHDSLWLYFIVRVYVPFWNMHVRPSILICQPICQTKKREVSKES